MLDSKNIGSIFENKKNFIGVILFLVSIAMLSLMVFNRLNYSFIHIDEWYTLSLLQMSFVDALKLTAADMHPPLYYLISKAVIKMLTLAHIPFNEILVSKLVSIMPYFLLLIFSATKIRKEYGWLTAGILVFAFGTMSEFFFKFITLRMYGWGMLFLLLSFLYLKDVLRNSDKKSWALLTIFSVLGAYTHYFIAISAVLIYLCLLVHILFIRDYEDDSKSQKINELKKWIFSSIAGILLYSPWIPVVFNQVNTPTNYWIPELDLGNVINFVSYFATNSKNEFLIALAILFLIVLFATTALKLKNLIKIEKTYLIIGLITSVFTFLFLLGFSIFAHPILLPRYLIPLIGILWFVFAIVIGKLENKYLLTGILCLILLFGASGILETHDISNHLYDLQIHDQKLLNEMNTNDTVIIHTNGINVIMFNKYLNNTKQYSLSNIYGSQLHHSLNFKEKTFNDVEDIIDKNEAKRIFIIKNKGGEMPNLGENRSAEKIDEICDSREVFIIHKN